MERRLLTNFNIGIVDGVMNDVLNISKGSKDVFAQLAKVIQKHTASKKKKDWNTLVRSNTVRKDPIGSAKEAMIRQSCRQSLRQHIIDHSKSSTVDQDKLLGTNFLC